MADRKVFLQRGKPFPAFHAKDLRGPERRIQRYRRLYFRGYAGRCLTFRPDKDIQLLEDSLNLVQEILPAHFINRCMGGNNFGRQLY